MTIFPALRYRDANRAVNWLESAFGLKPIFTVPGPDGTIAHAEMTDGKGVIMFGTGAANPDPAADPSTAQHTIYMYVDDVHAHAERARAAGAEITMEPTTMDYGATEYAAKDFEGNHWSFGTHLPKPDG